ncbi:hypothetical protein HH308_06420 [Gordonia sp. TBRC 11910]|uniref:Uncharacterized protein n=1 Tax=Gordonia asplenii TaxID=2725283 RepID=A0A848KS95_9ACTN|nr:hypothetical protein [Gordonia asplenii]NMO00847.1 hypothetical protein [Gordonia asplenii]
MSVIDAKDARNDAVYLVHCPVGKVAARRYDDGNYPSWRVLDLAGQWFDDEEVTVIARLVREDGDGKAMSVSDTAAGYVAIARSSLLGWKVEADADGNPVVTIELPGWPDDTELRAWAEWFTAATDYWQQNAAMWQETAAWWEDASDQYLTSIYKAAGLTRGPLDLDAYTTVRHAIGRRTAAVTALLEEAHRLHLSYDVTMTGPEVAALIRTHLEGDNE